MKLHHDSIAITTLLALLPHDFADFVHHPDGPAAARADLRARLAAGKTHLVLGHCDHQTAAGQCAGHDQDGQP